jgi:hypothetical protein
MFGVVSFTPVERGEEMLSVDSADDRYAESRHHHNAQGGNPQNQTLFR